VCGRTANLCRRSQRHNEQQLQGIQDAWYAEYEDRTPGVGATVRGLEGRARSPTTQVPQNVNFMGLRRGGKRVRICTTSLRKMGLSYVSEAPATNDNIVQRMRFRNIPQ